MEPMQMEMTLLINGQIQMKGKYMKIFTHLSGAGDKQYGTI